MFVESPKCLRKNRIQPENSVESLAWSDSHMHDASDTSSDLNMKNVSLPALSVERAPEKEETFGDDNLLFLPAKCVLQKDCLCVARVPKHRSTDKECVHCWKLPWILITNSLLQIFIYTWGNKSAFNLLVYSPHKRKELLVALPLEAEQGHLRVLIVYLGGVFAGALGASILQPNLLMVGASAGVYSLLISHLPHIAINFERLSYRYFRIASVAVLCTSDVLFVINHCMTQGNSEPRISLAAHGSGAVAGLLLGFIVYNGAKASTSMFRALRYLSMFMFACAVVASILLNINTDLWSILMGLPKI